MRSSDGGPECPRPQGPAPQPNAGMTAAKAKTDSVSEPGVLLVPGASVWEQTGAE